MTIRDQAAVVGVGATPYYKRGQSYPQTELSMACKAILLALDDAGLSVQDLDGFALYAQACEPAEVAATLGIPEVRYTTMITGGGGRPPVPWVRPRPPYTEGWPPPSPRS